MNPHELKAARKLLFFSTAEAARWIGQVNVSTWHRWENGKVPIPADVEAEMLALIAFREQTIASLPNSNRALGSLESLDSWISRGNHEKHWRPYQSAVAANWAVNSAPQPVLRQK